MPDWCPKCHAMLPPGLETCPNCGARLEPKKPSKIAFLGQSSRNAGFSNQDIFWLSVYIIGIGMIPILLAVVIGLLCFYLGR